MKEIFSRNDIPETVVSDNASIFNLTNSNNSALERILQKNSAPNHPATNGQAKRYVQTIKDKLAAFVNKLFRNRATPIMLHNKQQKCSVEGT